MNCWIKLSIPNDLVYVKIQMYGSGFFTGEERVIEPDVENYPGQTYNTVIKFKACQDPFGLGPSPSGRLRIQNIQTPSSQKPMKPIGFEIYSDFRYENLVARIAKASGLD